MITLILLVIALVAIAIVAAIGGVTAVLVFGDVIIAAIIVVWIIRAILRRR